MSTDEKRRTMKDLAERVETAVEEAKRFLIKAEDYLDRAKIDEWVLSDGCCKESGAVKRASMDLTRALADMRRVR